MRIDILTLFPETCDTMMNESIIGRARRLEKFELYCHNIRDYTLSKQGRVDDYPYGGGHGMVMQAEPIARCLDTVLEEYEKVNLPRPLIFFMSPAGAQYTQKTANKLAKLSGLVLVCGHYEGIDQRVIDEYADGEISLGDFVLSGGEIAALAVADSVLRLQPGVLKDPEGYMGDSFYEGTLEHPQYTRPESWKNRSVPSVLLSGHAANIHAWRCGQSIKRTRERRFDLYLNLPPEVASPPATFPKKKKKK